MLRNPEKSTGKGSVWTSACSGAFLGLLVMHACIHARVCESCLHVCVCPGICTPAQTEWVGSVGWCGAPWIPLQASSLSGPAKVSCLPVGGWLGVGRAGRGTLQQHGHWGLSTLCQIATAKFTHTRTHP